MIHSPKYEGKLVDVPLSRWVLAYAQWLLQTLILIPVFILSVFPMGILVALVTKRMTNVFGETSMPHKQKYIDKGSSGTWFYTGTNIPIIKWWGNLEDGQMGEDSGRWSASRKGKEDTFISKYLWAIRNPFNYFKRTSRFMSCYIDDCTIRYYGLESVSDKDPNGPEGGYLCIAKDSKTKRVFHGMRYIKYWDRCESFVKLTEFVRYLGLKKLSKWMKGRCLNVSFGFKIKPSHAYIFQDIDDKDKASTMRVQFFSKIN